MAELIMIYGVLSLDNIETFRKEYNNKMKVVFGVDNWIKHYETKNKCKLENFIGMPIKEVEEQLSHIDRDYEE